MVSRSALLKGGYGTRQGVLRKQRTRSLTAQSGNEIESNARLAVQGMCWGWGERSGIRLLLCADWKDGREQIDGVRARKRPAGAGCRVHEVLWPGIQQQSRFVAHSLRTGIRWRKWCFAFNEQNTICASRDGSDRWGSGQVPG